MAPDRTAVIDQSARRALQMCDIVLSESIRTKAFRPIFKEPKYLSAILGIFEGVRDLLIKILRRVPLIEDTTACLSTCMVITEVTALPRKQRLVASVNSLAHRLALYPLFFSTDGAEDVAALHSVQYNDPGDPDKTRARAMIHELVHYVSYHRYPHFRDQISSPCAQHFLDNVTDRMVNDIQPIDFALDSSDEDWKLVGWFGGSKAYGQCRVEKLAQLHHGARASLLNADSYALFAVDCMERYFLKQVRKARNQKHSKRQGRLIDAIRGVSSSMKETSRRWSAPTSPTSTSNTPTATPPEMSVYEAPTTRSQTPAALRKAKEEAAVARRHIYKSKLRQMGSERRYEYRAKIGIAYEKS